MPKALKKLLARLESFKETAQAGDEASIREGLKELTNIVEAEFSHDDKRQILRGAIKEKVVTEDEYTPWIRDTFDTYFIYEYKGKLYKVSYVIDDKGKATLGEPQEVVLETNYIPVTEAGLEEGKNKDDQLKEGDSLDGDVIELVEGTLRRDGTVPIKIISPGWGSSGYYSKELLEGSADKYKQGTHMYWNHPTALDEKERPERDLRDLAAVLVSDGRFDESGPKGPGIYADAKVFSGFKEAIEEMAEHIGTSHRALGKAKSGMAEGKKGKIIESIDTVQSVDFVTKAGRGGEIVKLFESFRNNESQDLKEVKNVKLEETVKKLEGEVATLTESNEALSTENARLKEANILTEAKSFVATQLAEVKIPQLTKDRLAESLVMNPPAKDGALDREALKETIDKAVKAEIDYLSGLLESGTIKGMGSSSAEGGDEDVTKHRDSLEESFKTLGLSESAAKIAASK